MGVLREIFTGIRNFIGSAAHVSNLMALFLVLALMGLVAYALYARETYLATIIGFSSAIIGTITGYYFNKEHLSAAQRGERGEELRAGDYFRDYQDLELEHANLTANYDAVVELLDKAIDALPEDADISVE